MRTVPAGPARRRCPGKCQWREALGWTRLAMADQTYPPPSDRAALRRLPKRSALRPGDRAGDPRRAGSLRTSASRPPTVRSSLPMAYGRTEDTLYLHGSGELDAARSPATEICVTVTLIDGLVFARTPFHNSMNYRSVVIRGVGETGRRPGRARRRASDESPTTSCRTGNTGASRPTAEIRKTMVIALPLRRGVGEGESGDPGRRAGRPRRTPLGRHRGAGANLGTAAWTQTISGRASRRRLRINRALAAGTAAEREGGPRPRALPSRR